MNNRFSFSRFAAVLKCDLVEHRWRYISAFFIMFVALSGFQLAQVNDYLRLSKIMEGVDIYRNFTDTLTAFFCGVLILALICAAADMSSVPFKTKGRALNYLVMPASKLEKFLSRAFINILLVIVMAYVALFFSDLVRMLCIPFFKVDGLNDFYGFTVHQIFVNLFDPFKAVFENGNTNTLIVNGEVLTPVWSFGMCCMAVACIILSGLWSHSVFLLGGCIWRKGALIKTIASALVISLLLLWLIVECAPCIDVWAENRLAPWLEQRFETEEDMLRVGFPIVAFLNTVFIAINWWLAYRLFSRKQMTPRTHLFGSKHPHHLFKKAHS